MSTLDSRSRARWTGEAWEPALPVDELNAILRLAFAWLAADGDARHMDEAEFSLGSHHDEPMLRMRWPDGVWLEVPLGCRLVAAIRARAN